MKRIKFGLLALAAVCGVTAAATATNNAAKRTLPHMYFAQSTGASSFIWVEQQPGAPLLCQSRDDVSCTITTTVAPESISDYNNTYLPGRQKNPATPTDNLYR